MTRLDALLLVALFLSPGLLLGLSLGRWASKSDSPPSGARRALSALLVGVTLLALLVGGCVTGLGGPWQGYGWLARVAAVSGIAVLAMALPDLVRGNARRRRAVRLGVVLAIISTGGALAWSGAAHGGDIVWWAFWPPYDLGQTGAPRIRHARVHHTATLLTDGRVLVAGGDGPLDSVEIYDPQRGEWQDARPMRQARLKHTATLLNDGRVLVAGGSNCRSNCTTANSMPSAEIFDPASGVWTAAATMASGRNDHGATLLKDGRVLVAGGNGWEPGLISAVMGGFRTLASAEIYDPSTDRWKAAPAMHYARYGGPLFTLPDGDGLVVCGRTFNGDFSHASHAAAELALQTEGTTERFDPAAETWTLGARSPEDFDAAPWHGLLPNGEVLTLAGWARGNAWVYDPRADAWARLGVTGHAGEVVSTFAPTVPLVVLPDGHVLAAGGTGPGSSPESWLFDPSSASWTATKPMNLARQFHDAIVLRSGKALVFGGRQEHDELGDFGRYTEVWTSEVFDPGSGTWVAR